MRAITNEQVELIDAVLAEKDVGGLTPAILEKDIHVTDVLRVLSGIGHGNFQLVFCGGTSLAKAHGMIARMSEDIDIKLVLADVPGLARSAINKQLKDLKKRLVAAMTAFGFVADEAEFKTFNENRYFRAAWFYQRRYSGDVSLRPHLILEFTLRQPCFPLQTYEIGYLVNQLAELGGPTISFPCIAVEETLAEKILSFLRRFALHRSGNMLETWDTALVRHIYDVYCIMQTDTASLERATTHFKDLLDFDVQEFTKHAAFIEDPAACLAQALIAIETDRQTQTEYETRLLPLIYGEIRPSFEEAFVVFRRCALRLIEIL